MTFRIDLFKHYMEMCRQNMILSFKGTLSQEILADLGEIIKNYVGDLKERPRVVRRVFSIFIEVAQNILHHSAEKVTLGDRQERGAGIIMVSETEEEFEIVSGNLITNSSAKAIEESCNIVNSLDKEGLKKAFLEKINLPVDENQKGAGLGLIDIARKSENKIQFKIERVDRTHSFFMLSVKIDK